MKKKDKVLIVGAGLCGSLLALRLAQRGFKVAVYESRPDLRKTDISAGRSINLALSDRGLKALRLAGVEEEALPYSTWLKSLNPSKEKVERIAKKMDGFPYLWGGTSSKGMDCSGFTKMVYLMNGFVIPRDASQQINAGRIVDKNLDFKNLEKGDLMFFGRKATPEKKQRVVHVGLWLGNDKMEFIHASGNVHVSSMSKDELNYDEFNKKRYLGSRRYLDTDDEKIINLKETIKLLQ